MSGKKPESGGRYARADWIRTAWEILHEDAAERLPIAEIARRMGVTKGSFYWHFEDRSDFQQAMLAHYRDAQTDMVIRAMRKVEGSAAERLRRLILFIAHNIDANLERTVFDWATLDAGVARALKEEYQRRADFVAELLRRAGVAPKEARSRGLAFASMIMGWYLTRTEDVATELPRHARAIAALFGS